MVFARNAINKILSYLKVNFDEIFSIGGLDILD